MHMKKWDKLVLLSRHLPTMANEKGIIMGRKMDPPINRGWETDYRKNIRWLKKSMRLNKKDLDFYSSPSLRCQQTIEIAISEIGEKGQNYQIDERLWETDCGSFSGKNAKQIRQDSPELLDMWVKHPEKMKFPGGESYNEVQLRTLNWLKETLKKEARMIFVVTHVDVIKMAVFGAVNIPISSKRLITIDPGSITVLGIRGNETVLLNSNLFGGVT